MDGTTDAALASAEAACDAATLAIDQQTERALAIVDEQVETGLADAQFHASAALAAVCTEADAGISALDAHTAAALTSLEAMADDAVTEIGELADDKVDGIETLEADALDHVEQLGEAVNDRLTDAQTSAGIVFDAVALLNERADDIGQAEEDSDERDTAVLTATATVTRLMEQLPPDLQRQVLEQSEGSIGTIVANFGHLSGDETAQAIGDLSMAAEFAGRDNVHLLTDVMASRMEVDEHELLGGVERAITDGNGALLSTALVDAVYATGDTELASSLAVVATEAIGEVTRDYDDARTAFEARQRELARADVELAGRADPGGPAGRASTRSSPITPRTSSGSTPARCRWAGRSKARRSRSTSGASSTSCPPTG